MELFAVTIATIGAVSALKRYRRPHIELEHRSKVISALLPQLTLLRKGYSPPALLPTGIGQSFAAIYYAPSPAPTYRRQQIELPELDFRRRRFWPGRAKTACCPETVPAGVVTLDWLDVPDASAPIVLLVPGLTGSSGEAYIQRAALGLHSAGMRVAVFNPRSRGGVELSTPFLYSAGYTEDLRRVVEVLASGFLRAPLLAAGYSLGSSYLLKYCCEEADRCILRGVALFGCPVDLERTGAHLDSSAVGRLVNPTLVRCGPTQGGCVKLEPARESF